MARTHEKVRYTPKSRPEKLTPITAARGVENALKILEGRWKLVILFHLFGGKVLRFSDLERAIPAISQKMLIQQLRRMEADGVIQRILHPQVPPKVEYRLNLSYQKALSTKQVPPRRTKSLGSNRHRQRTEAGKATRAEKRGRM